MDQQLRWLLQQEVFHSTVALCLRLLASHCVVEHGPPHLPIFLASSDGTTYAFVGLILHYPCWRHLVPLGVVDVHTLQLHKVPLEAGA